MSTKTVEIKVGVDTSAGTTKIAKIGRDFDTMAGHVKSAAERMRSALLPTNGLLTSISAGLIAWKTYGLAKSFYEVGLAVERMNAGLKAALGTVELATETQAFLRTESDRLGLVFAEQASGYQKLSAAARGTRLEGAALREVFLGLVEGARATQMTSEELQGAVLAVGQMMSKGTVAAEELRGQLGERMPGAFQVAARAMGVTTAELGKMLEQGQLLAEDFLPKFAAQLRKELGGAATDAAQTLEASVNRLKNAWFDFRVEVMQSGVLEFLRQGAITATSELKRLKEEGRLDEWAQQMAPKVVDALGSILVAVGHIVDACRGWQMIINGLLAATYSLLSVTARLAELRQQAELVGPELPWNKDDRAEARKLLAAARLDKENAAAGLNKAVAEIERLSSQEPAAKNAAQLVDSLKKSIFDQKNQPVSQRDNSDAYSRLFGLKNVAPSGGAPSSTNDKGAGKEAADAAAKQEKEIAETMAGIAAAIDDEAHRSSKAFWEAFFSPSNFQPDINLKDHPIDRMVRDIWDGEDGLSAQIEELTTGWQAGAMNAFGEYAAFAQDKAGRLKDFLTTTMYSLEDLLVQTIQSGKFEFSGFVDYIIAELMRLMIRQNITGPMSEMLGGINFGGLMDGLLSFFPSAKGNVFASGRLVPFATGGIIPGPMVLPLAGEAGPEAIMPLGRTRGGDLGVKAHVTADAPPVTIQVINQTGTQASAKHSQPKWDGRQWVISVVLNELRRSPTFRSAIQNAG
jgi:tape measure domain-containing protein